MDGTDRERREPGRRRRTGAALNEFGTVWVIVGTVRVESGNSEVSTARVGSGSQTIAGWAGLTLYAGSSEDGGDGQEGGDQELSVEEHRENE